MAHLSDKEWRELVRLRRAVARAEQVLSGVDRALLADSGLCNTDVFILERLARKGPRPVNGLARRVGLTSGSMTAAVQRLCRRGLAETRRDVEDKRVVWVSPTADGETLAEAFAQDRREAFERIFAEWTTREQSLLTGLLKRLRKSGELGLPATGGTGGKAPSTLSKTYHDRP